MGFMKAKPAPPAPRPAPAPEPVAEPITTVSPELNSAMDQQARNDKTRARAPSAGTGLGEGDGQKISKKLLGS